MSASREEFARAAADFLRAQGESRAISIDERRDRLVVGVAPEHVSFIALAHAFKEFADAPPAERERIFQRRFWASIQRQAETRRDAVLRSVLPRVRDRAWFSAVRRQAELELGADETAIDEVMLPHQQLNDDLAVHLAFELPTSVMEIGPDRLEAWGLSFDELMARAKDNLRARSALPFEEAAPGVFVSPFHDGLDATRVVLPELFTSLRIKGAPIVVAPTHDILFVTGDRDDEGLAQVATWSEEALLEPRAHSAIAFRLEDGEWVPWLPPRSSASWGKFKLLALQTMASAYARQKEVLESLLEANGHSIFVASMRAFRGPGGDIFTACAWTENVEALLPQTDRIDFVRLGPDGNPNSGQVWSTTFDIARRTVPDLMEPIGDLPERWRVRSFPTPAQLEKMAAEGKLERPA